MEPSLRRLRPISLKGNVDFCQMSMLLSLVFIILLMLYVDKPVIYIISVMFIYIRKMKVYIKRKYFCKSNIEHTQQREGDFSRLPVSTDTC